MNTKFRKFIQYLRILGEPKTHYPLLVEQLGFAEAALFAHILISMKFDENDGWVERSFKELTLATGLSYMQLKRAKRALSLESFLEVKRGQTERLYRVPENSLEKLFSRVAHAAPDIINNIYTTKNNNILSQRVALGPLENKANSKEKEKEIKEDFNWPEYLKKMMSDSRQHIRIIGQFLKFKKLQFDSKAKIEAVIPRHLRSAKSLTPFSSKELRWAANYCRKKYEPIDVDWTLETILKTLSSRSNTDEI